MSFLVVDFGTSSCRSALVAPDGKVDVVSRRDVGITYRPGGAAELDVDYVWNTVTGVIRDCVALRPGADIDCMGVASLLGYVFLSSEYETLCPAILYMDTRAREEAAILAGVVPEERAYRRSGRRMSPELLAPKLLWTRNHRPEIYGRIRRVLGLKDEIVRRLTGVLATDWAHMNYTRLFDLAGRPDPELCGAVDVPTDFFPENGTSARVVGRVTAEAAELTGLPKGIPVVAGSIDGTSAMYGAGIAERNCAAVVSGTTDVLMTLTDEPLYDPVRSLNVNTGMIHGTFAVGGATGFSGGAVRRLSELLAEPFGPERSVENVTPESLEDLFVFPGFTGERAPYWHQDAGAGVLGIGMEHRPIHIMTAALESCGFRLARLLELLEAAGGGAEKLRIAGGSDIAGWNKIRADIAGLPVEVLAEREATVLGTAMFCRAALDEGQSLSAVAEKWIKVVAVIEPSGEAAEYYRKKRGKFERVMEILYGKGKNGRAGKRSD